MFTAPTVKAPEPARRVAGPALAVGSGATRSPESVARPVQLAQGSVTAPLPPIKPKRAETVEFPTIESPVERMDDRLRPSQLPRVRADARAPRGRASLVTAAPFSEAEVAFFAAGEALEQEEDDSFADDPDQTAITKRPTLWRRLIGRVRSG